MSEKVLTIRIKFEGSELKEDLGGDIVQSDGESFYGCVVDHHNKNAERLVFGRRRGESGAELFISIVPEYTDDGYTIYGFASYPGDSKDGILYTWKANKYGECDIFNGEREKSTAKIEIYQNKECSTNDEKAKKIAGRLYDMACHGIDDSPIKDSIMDIWVSGKYTPLEPYA